MAAVTGLGKNRKKLSAISWLLILIFVCQFVMLCYFNLTQMRNHTGYDSSWNFLRAKLMWDEKAVYSPKWDETTDLSLDNLLPFVSLLYGLTGNILLSFGIVNQLMVVLLLAFVWKILERLDVRLTGRLIALNLVICPYLTTGYSQYNDLGYFSCVLSSASYYSMRVLFVLMVVYAFLNMVQKGKLGVTGWVLFPVCLLSGFSSGVYLIVIMFVPFLAYEIEMTMIRSDWKQLIRKDTVFACICCALTVAGKILAMSVIRFEALDSTRSWTTLEKLWTNFGAVIQGFLKLTQALPVMEGYHVMSKEGILRMFALGIAAFMLIALAAVCRRTLKQLTEKDGAPLFLLNIVLVNFLVFGLFEVQYGASIFEERYLVTTFFVLVLITALFINELDEGKVGTTMLTLFLAVSIFMVDGQSDVHYLKTTNDEWQMDKIQAIAESQDAGIVYFWGDDLTVVSRAMRVCDTDRIYKALPDSGGWYIHWGDYTTYDRNEDFTGPTLLVFDREKQLVPEKVLAEFTPLAELDQVSVYGSDHNPKLF